MAGHADPGILGQNCAHISVDMQRMFAEPTDWHAPWMNKVLSAIEALVDAHAQRTIFTRFITPEHPEAAHGAWQNYYRRWASMTRQRLPADLLDLVPSLARHVPPAKVLDKTVYSPWINPSLQQHLSRAEIQTLIVTGGETEVCVQATVMGAIDHGYRVVLPIDAVCSSADETHDAMLRIYESRFGMQLATCSMQDVLDTWRPS